MLAWVTVETELMEPREAEQLYAPLGIEADSMSQERLEAAFSHAGFVVLRAVQAWRVEAVTVPRQGYRFAGEVVTQGDTQPPVRCLSEVIR